MPDDRNLWSGRIKAVERQFNTARFAVEHLRANIHRDPSLARRSPEPRYVAETGRDLEVAYLVRMFAEFESGLRAFWRSARPGRKPKTEHLIDNVASDRKIPGGLRVNAHTVRNYRNQIIHDNQYDEEIEPVSVSEARGYLVLFFARLPFEW